MHNLIFSLSGWGFPYCFSVAVPIFAIFSPCLCYFFYLNIARVFFFWFLLRCGKVFASLAWCRMFSVLSTSIKKKRKKKRRKRQKRRKREKEKKEIRKKKMEKTAINIIAGYPLIRFAIVEKTKCDAQHFFFFQPKFSYIISTQTDRPIPQGNGDGFLCKVDPLPAILILLYGNTNLPSQANPCTRARS